MEKIEFESMYNARGSRCILPSSATTAHLLIRSDNTAYATKSDIKTLQKLGIKTIIDIRSDKERAEEPDVFENVSSFDYFFFAFDSGDFAYYLSRNPKMLTISLLDGYISLLEQKDTVRKIISTVSDSLQNGGVLFHCSGGKDRTGLISMLLQSIMGIDKEEICVDYHQTYNNLTQSPKIQAWVEQFGEEYVFCDPKLISSSMEYIEKKYSSIVDYLRNCGILDEVINQLESIKIEKLLK